MKVNHNDMNGIASHIFLNEYEEKNNANATVVLYNKFMCLLNDHLKDNRIDMKLPHCWYRWGDEVVRYHMPYLGWNHEDSGHTEVVWKGRDVKYDLGDPTVSIIRDFADEFISKYSGEEGAELAIDDVYRKAPFRFQNEYRKLREAVKNLRKNALTSDVSSIIIPLFDDAISSFPNEFSKIDSVKDDFESVFRLAMRSNADIEDIYHISEDFWFFFCYHLRLNPKCYENVPRSTLDIWKEKIPWETDLYRHTLENYASKYQNSDKDKTISKLVQRKKKRDSEFDKLLTELDL